MFKVVAGHVPGRAFVKLAAWCHEGGSVQGLETL